MDSSINLKLLLKTCLFKDAELFTTEKGLDNPISSINIMDLLEIEQWLTGNELLIIGNFMKKYFTREFIDKLRAQKISAILSKKSFVIISVKTL
ncbi:PucR family transcriptional regulator ligand-binding domain-containing protein [Streptococcus didelphis]|uniref:PucR family transcriptional regulator ligand-binding domain-containing protein n=1 Tax=Streptococcus didelphis TaxID=102886 RepID=A0ABY9LGK9_9STRE|nr:PucR family transcriptional regulator ligand-binding domain-containing protein [Streptococcus didelphis]WMB27970.1 PucR family transcriptional regulator ligand-binding domain-containing protein [Streptococcus didelphis]WMB29564.1 PucR family transcriptional regulator ligand-binding domain-containing protein [Streptococcus didelphis]